MNAKRLSTCPEPDPRAPFTDAGGNCTLPRNELPADPRTCQLVMSLAAGLQEPHRRDFIRLQRKVFGIKLVGVTDDG